MILFSCTNDSFMEDLLYPESTNATIGNFEPSDIMTVPHVSNKFVEHLLCTNFGLFCNSHKEKYASSGDNHWICCTRSGMILVVHD